MKEYKTPPSVIPGLDVEGNPMPENTEPKRCPCCGAELAEGQFYIDPYSRVSAAAPLRDGVLSDCGHPAHLFIQDSIFGWTRDDKGDRVEDSMCLMCYALQLEEKQSAPDPLRDAAQRVMTNLAISGIDGDALSDSFQRALIDLRAALTHPAPTQIGDTK